MSTTTSRPALALAAACLLVSSCAGPGEEGPPGEGAGPAATATAPSPSAPPRDEPAAQESTTASPTGGAPSAPAPTAAPSPSPSAPAGPETGAPAPGPAGPGDAPTAAPALKTWSGTAADAAFALEMPAAWTVQGEFTDVGGTVTVLGEDGAPVAHLSVLVAWGAECGPGCPTPPVVHLGDVPGGAPLSRSGEFVVRSVAMDLGAEPELRNLYGWQGPVRLTTSLTDAEVPPPETMLPHVMYGLGLVETGVVAVNGITYRTVVLSSVHDFATLQEAEAYTASEEHRQVQAMIASFRA